MGINSHQLNYQLETSKGLYPKHEAVYKFGFNPVVKNTEELIWYHSGAYVYPDQNGQKIYISSTDANDTAAGTGARTVQIQGLDANYDQVDEIVSLAGQAQVESSLDYIRVHRVRVESTGTSNDSEGTIYAADSGSSAGVPTGNVYANLGGGNQSLLALYTVPRNHTLYLDDVNFGAGISTGNVFATVRFNIRSFTEGEGDAFRTVYINTVQSASLVYKFEYPLALPEKTDIQMTAEISSNVDSSISASFQGVLVDETDRYILTDTRRHVH